MYFLGELFFSSGLVSFLAVWGVNVNVFFEDVVSSYLVMRSNQALPGKVNQLIVGR